MFVIGVTGGTASGKTTFVSLLKEKCKDLSVNFISQDDYYANNSHLSIKERELINFDHPNSLDFKLLRKHIDFLREGKAIEKPTYDFTTHNRTLETKTLLPTKVLIIEGILVLSHSLIKDIYNKSIYIEAPEGVRKQRRIVRDVMDRGRTKKSVIEQFENHISPMHNQFIKPLKNNADFVFDGTKNFSGPINIVFEILKKQL